MTNAGDPIQLPEVASEQLTSSETALEQLSLSEIKELSLAALEAIRINNPNLKTFDNQPLTAEGIRGLDPDMLALRLLEITQNVHFGDLPRKYRSPRIDNYLLKEFLGEAA